MYAYDMALVATSALDLQRMLDALYNYCRLWRMFVNVKKTKAVVFHKCSSAVRCRVEKELKLLVNMWIAFSTVLNKVMQPLPYG